MNTQRRERLAQAAKGGKSFDVPIDRNRLGGFINGYVKAALETDNNDFFGDGKPFDVSYSIHSISERTMAQMIRDCLNYYWRSKTILEEAMSFSGMTLFQAGYCFWKSRNRDFGGYEDYAEDSWDDKLDALHRGAVAFGPFKLTITEGEVDADYTSVGKQGTTDV